MNRLTGLCVTSMAMMLASTALPAIARAQCTATGSGDTCTQPGSVSMIAGRVVRLQMTAGSTALTAPTTAHFDAGFTARRANSDGQRESVVASCSSSATSDGD